MRTRDWNDPRLQMIGEQAALNAYDLASELEDYGADAAVYLLSLKQFADRMAKRPAKICIPTSMADAVMAILLSLPRPDQGRGRRRGWSPRLVQESLDRGKSLRASAREEEERTGRPAATIERGMRARRAKAKAKPQKD